MSEIPVYTHVDQYLQVAKEHNASDLHLAVGYPPAWRRNGQLKPIWSEAAPLKGEDTDALVRSFVSEKQWAHLQEKGDVDYAYQNEDGRYRTSVVKQRLGYDICFRIINTKVRSMEDLGLPLESILPLARYQNGLLLVTGSMGSGKSTTLAAITEFINNDREDHILTLEHPIEYQLPSKKCHINQREIKTHTESFSKALRGALRQDPDVIVVGEMSNLETIQLALTAAETGHLVLATLHTGNAPRTLDRILDVFPTDQREQIRTMVSESLRGVISQQLVPSVDGSKREIALELLVNTPAVANCIREGKTFMLPGIMQTGKSVGMITMDDSLRELYVKGLIAKEEVLFRAEDKNQMKLFLEV